MVTTSTRPKRQARGRTSQAKSARATATAQETGKRQAAAVTEEEPLLVQGRTPPPHHLAAAGTQADSVPTVVNETEPDKVIRDTFSFHPEDYPLIAELQDSYLDLRMRVGKSDVIRAGLHALKEMDAENRKRIMQGLPRTQPGRRSNKQVG